MTPLALPEPSLVLLVGPSGAGKSTFARKHFRPTEVLSSDFCRGLVRDDENDQSATNDAFDVLRYVAAKRLVAGRLTVIDATNVQPEARKPLLDLAREHHTLAVAVVLHLPEKLCHDRNQARPERSFGPHVVRGHCQALRRSLKGLRREGFSHVYVLESPDEIEAVTFQRQPLWVNRSHEAGPFDIVGDVHGCCDELEELLARLGYGVVGAVADGPFVGTPIRAHPEGRKVVFLGDLVDRGPRVLDALRLAMAMTAHGSALCVPGNHEVKLLNKLRGKEVRIAHGLDRTLAELEAVTANGKRALADWLDGLISHFVLDGGKLVVAHAGMKEALQGRASGVVRAFALYGETTGETDEFGLPVRYDWAAEYRGPARVVYGHTPVPEPEWLNRTINVDTGCVFGGKLTALRYPEMELVSVAARRVYAEPIRPLKAEQPARSAQQEHDDVLDLEDVSGKRLIATRLASNVTIRAENATAALEAMSRFAADPRWLIYLPPTMSPAETSREPGWLERPEEALANFRGEGVPRVVCQEKHMGSRAVVVVCRDEAAAWRRFGVSDEAGVVLTRTGRRFFDDRAIETELLDRLRAALTRAGFWDEFASDWFCLDCELMPWSAKAQDLLQQQYAAVGSAATAATSAVVAALETAIRRDPAAQPLLDRERERADLLGRYVAAYRRYCWPVRSVADLRLAPFHLLAGETGTFFDRDHAWHMATLTGLCHGDDVLFATASLVVDFADPASVAAAVAWWEDRTAQGGEGMVVKPLDWVTRGRRGLVQPAVKCRGREYLRIIYGPEYTRPENLDRLRRRGLSGKRSLAVREFALGVEALERFVRREPLRRVHECVFGVLALESEPVDPRL